MEYGEPWMVSFDGVQIWDAHEKSVLQWLNENGILPHIVRCVNACAGMSDEELDDAIEFGGIKTILDSFESEVEMVRKLVSV